MQTYLIEDIKTVGRRSECDGNRASTYPARLLVVPESMFCRSLVSVAAAAAAAVAAAAPGNHFRPPPSHFRRIWIGPDNIAVGAAPRLHAA